MTADPVPLVGNAVRAGPARRTPEGNVVRADAPLGRIPLFLRDGAHLPITG